MSVPCVANNYSFYNNIGYVTGPDNPANRSFDSTLANYFAQVESKAAYLIAECFIQVVVEESCVNGCIDAPQKYKDMLDSLEYAKTMINITPAGSVEMAYWITEQTYLERLPLALLENNNNASSTAYNFANDTINISNPNNLTIYEKYAILATHSGNVTFNSFSAELEYHADGLYKSVADYDAWYSRVIRADMAIGEASENRLFDEYYDLDSDIVQAQIEAHGEY